MQYVSTEQSSEKGTESRNVRRSQTMIILKVNLHGKTSIWLILAAITDCMQNVIDERSFDCNIPRGNNMITS